MRKAKPKTITIAEAEKDLGIHHMTMMRRIWDNDYPAFKDENDKWHVNIADHEVWKAQYLARGGNRRGPKRGSAGSNLVKQNVKISKEHAKKIALVSVKTDKTVVKLIEEFIDEVHGKLFK